MDHAEATGFTVAFAGHAALIAALSLGVAAVKVPPVPSDPIEVSFVEEAGLSSTAPTPSPEAPTPRLGEVEGPPAPAPLPLAPAAPVPQPLPAPPRVEPKPQPQAVAQPQRSPVPKPTPVRAEPPRPTGRLSGVLSGIGDKPSESKAVTPPAAQAGPEVQSALRAAVRRQLKPHWRAPSGADVELLRTQATVTLSRTGAVVSIDDIETTGQTPSNRSQVKLHQEQAVRAIRLAAPFQLPAEFYDAWKVIQPVFDRRLSQ